MKDGFFLPGFEFIEQPQKKDSFNSADLEFDYFDDNAEAVVYMITPSGKCDKNCLFVIKKGEAIKLCSHPSTKSNNPGREWALCFTTHKRDWRDDKDSFRKDDGRFNDLLKQMGIIPIFREN